MRTTPTEAQKTALMLAMQTLIDAVKEGGEMGAPGGVMYAALLGKLTLNQFNSAMSALVRQGYLRQDGNLYFWVRDLIPESRRPECQERA